MAKRWVAGAAVGLLVLGFSLGATAASIRKQIEVEYSGVKVKVDGQVVDTGAAQPFVVVEEGRTYVPARYLAEALNAKVGWDAAAKSVLVFTPRYVESRTEKNVTTYTLPYYGVSATLPAGGKRLPSESLLLQVGSDRGFYGLMRTHFGDELPFAAAVRGVSAGLKAVLPFPFTVVAEEPVQVAGAKSALDLRGTYESPAGPGPLYLRFVAERDNLWVLLALGNPTADQDGAATQAFLNSFAIGK